MTINVLRVYLLKVFKPQTEPEGWNLQLLELYRLVQFLTFCCPFRPSVSKRYSDKFVRALPRFLPFNKAKYSSSFCVLKSQGMVCSLENKFCIMLSSLSPLLTSCFSQLSPLFFKYWAIVCKMPPITRRTAAWVFFNASQILADACSIILFRTRQSMKMICFRSFET